MRTAARWAWLVVLAHLGGCATPPAPIGPVDAPQVAEVLGKPVHAANLPQMQQLIVRELTDRYAADQGIAVTANDIDNYLRAQQQFMAAQGVRASDAEDDAATRAARQEVARAFILQRKIDAALQRQYGGRIAWRPGGAEPVDAYRRFLEDEAAAGRLRILDPALAREFWRLYTDDSRHRFAPEGSEEAQRAFDLPVPKR